MSKITYGFDDDKIHAEGVRSSSVGEKRKLLPAHLKFALSAVGLTLLSYAVTNIDNWFFK